jgi:hypothetical protein
VEFKAHGSEPADVPRKGRYFYTILFSEMMFEELARNQGFAVFTTFNSVRGIFFQEIVLGKVDLTHWSHDGGCSSME